MSGLRKAEAKQIYQKGVNASSSWSVENAPNANVSNFIPKRNTLYVATDSNMTATRTYTITEAGLATQNLDIGEGIEFVLANHNATYDMVLSPSITVMHDPYYNTAQNGGHMYGHIIYRTSPTTHAIVCSRFG